MHVNLNMKIKRIINERSSWNDFKNVSRKLEKYSLIIDRKVLTLLREVYKLLCIEQQTEFQWAAWI